MERLAELARRAVAASGEYQATRDPRRLDAAVTAWRRVLADPRFSEIPDGLRVEMLCDAGLVLLSLHAATGSPGDLDEAIAHLSAGAGLASGAGVGGLEHAHLLSLLGRGLRQRHEIAGSIADLEDAVVSFRGSLELTPSDDDDLEHRLSSLGSALLALAEAGGSVAHFDEAIQVFERGLDSATPGSARRSALLSNLGNCLRNRYGRTGNLAYLHAAVQRLREAVDGCPPDAPQLAPCLANLASGLADLWHRTGDIAHLDSAIAAVRRALDLGAGSPADLATWRSNLGLGLLERYEAGGAAGDLDAAITSCREALSATPAGSPYRPLRLTNIANALRRRYLRSGQVTDLEAAISSYRLAADGTPVASPDHAPRLSNLASGLGERYRRLGDRADLEAEIDTYRRALEAAQPAAPTLAGQMSNLAIALHHRYERTGELADLEDGIELCATALALPMPGPETEASIRGTMGMCLQGRFERRGDPRSLDAAIESYRRAIALSAGSGPERAVRLGNLGGALSTRHRRVTASQADLDDAISALTGSVAQLDAASPQRRPFANALALALQQRFRHTGRTEDLGAAVAELRAVIEATDASSPERPAYLVNLGGCLADRHERTRDPEDLRGAMSALREAGELGMETAVEAALVAARSLSVWATERGSWTEAAEAGETGLRAMERLFRAQLRRDEKEAWLREAGRLPSTAALALVRVGRTEDAAVALERGRALLLSEALERSRTSVERLRSLGHADLCDHYTAASLEVRQMERVELARTGSPPRTEEVRAARTRLDDAIAAVRRVKGFEGFQVMPGFEAVARAARTAPLAYLAATNAGGLALVVREDGSCAALDLPELARAALEDRAGAFAQASSARRRDPAGWRVVLDAVTRWLWDACMRPLLAELGPSERLTIVAADLLGTLPLHAAWTEDADTPTGRRYAIDQVAIGYAPNARAVASAAATTAAPGDSVLSVAGPDAAGGPLVHTAAEISAVRALFPVSRRLDGRAATRAAVLEALPAHDVLHFACHGRADAERPLQSGFALAGGGRLTVADFMAQPMSRPRVALLSACESAVTGESLPDEVIGLPAALIESGLSAVVGTLWAVPDLSAMLVVRRFCELWRGELMEPGEALRRAQIWVRDSTNRQKRDRYPDVAALAGPSHPAARRFWDGAHGDREPDRWAAFCYVGA